MSSFQLSSLVLVPVAMGAALLTSACGVPVAVSAASYAADGALLASSNKTSTDHIASVVTEKDCAVWRVFRGRRMCSPRAEGEDPYDTDYSAPQRTVSESGVSYSSPLRPAPDSPAVSWEAAAYDPPAPTAAARQTRPASVAPSDGGPPPHVASPAPAQPKKAKTVRGSAKKPSRGPAASAP